MADNIKKAVVDREYEMDASKKKEQESSQYKQSLLLLMPEIIHKIMRRDIYQEYGRKKIKSKRDIRNKKQRDDSQYDKKKIQTPVLYLKDHVY